MAHDDGEELTFDNIVNDSGLYASDVLNRIEKIDSFWKIVLENRIELEYYFLNRNALLRISWSEGSSQTAKLFASMTIFLAQLRPVH